MVYTTISTELRAKAVAAGATVDINQTVVESGFKDFFFQFTGTGAAASINELSTIDLTDTIIPLERLVFNNHDLESGDITLNTTTNQFTIATGKVVFVGIYISAYHDQLKPSVAGTLFGRGHNNPVDVWS